MHQTLVVLAAGLSTRYGANKQLASVGPADEVLLDYAVYDAVRAGFSSVTFVIRKELESEFQSHASRRFGSRLRISFAYQNLHDLPKGMELPRDRVKPWGTAHAVLAVREVVNQPFVVINADDFYGRSAYSALFEFHERRQDAKAPEFAMIGYRLNDTLSEYGGVSRAICECNDAGFLERLVEVKKIQRVGDEIVGVTTSGARYTLNGRETVSMNIWALTPTVFPLLTTQFEKFLLDHRGDPDAEFLISSALNEQIASGASRLEVIESRDGWFGMTFQEDRHNVKHEIASLVDNGVYPEDLTRWFRENR